MNVLLVGGAGFLGSNLAERLLNDGLHSVTVVDASGDRVSGFRGNPNLRLVTLDVGSEDDAGRLEDEVSDADVVVGLADMDSDTDPVAAFELCFTANLRLARMCLKHNKWMIQFTTGEVYGMTAASAAGLDESGLEDGDESASAGAGKVPFVEDDSPLVLGPVRHRRWMHACAHQMLERVLAAHGFHSGLKFTIIRHFNVLGPKMDALPSEKTSGASSISGRGRPTFVCKVIDTLLYGTGPIKLINGGEGRRSYVDVDDAVDFVVRVIDSRGAGTRGEIFNIGNPNNEISMRELADRLCNMFDRNFRKPEDPERPTLVNVSSVEGYHGGDRRVPDISKARSTLGWEPHHDLDWALFRTMEYYNKHFRGEDKDN